MNLQQLRYIHEVARNGLNISAAAQVLYTSQPGISTQIRQLEEELGVCIFECSSRQLSSITPAGKRILALAEEVLLCIDCINQTAREYTDPDKGSLRLATTHTQARYVLPPPSSPPSADAARA